MFLIWQVVHEDIHHSSYKMRKVQFLWPTMKDKRKDHAAKVVFFNRLKYPFQPVILCFFIFRRKNSCHDQMVKSWHNRWLALSYRMYRLWGKANVQFTSLYLWWSLAMVTWYLHPYSHVTSDSMWMPTSSA